MLIKFYVAFKVRINDESGPPIFSTGLIGKDNAIARHGIHGMYWLYGIVFPGFQLYEGRNTIFLTQSRGSSPFKGLMYDYIRLETTWVDRQYRLRKQYKTHWVFSRKNPECRACSTVFSIVFWNFGGFVLFLWVYRGAGIEYMVNFQ